MTPVIRRGGASLLLWDATARLRHPQEGGAVHPMTLPPDHDESPRGTLYIVSAFGILVALGWLLLYFGLFLPRVTP
jgi:hypothetical protein